MNKMENKSRKKKLKKPMNKLLACMLVVALGLSSYPVYATDMVGASYEQLEDTNAKMAYQLPADDVVVDNVESNDDVESPAEVEPEENVEPPADDSDTINLANDNISSSEPKLDDLLGGGDESQLVIPQGEDEHDYSTFSGIVSDNNTGSLFNVGDTKSLGGITIQGGTEGIDWTFEYEDFRAVLRILTSTKITLSSTGNPRKQAFVAATGVSVVNIELDGYEVHTGATHMQFTRCSTINIKVRGYNAICAQNDAPITFSQGLNEILFTVTGNSAADTLNLGETVANRSPLFSNNWNIHRIGLQVIDATVLATRDGVPAHNNMGPKITQVTRGTGNINGVTFRRTSQAGPHVSLITSTARQVTVSTPALDFATPIYSLDGVTWQNSPIFTELKAGQSYFIHAKFIESAFRLESETSITPISTQPAVYTVNIPATSMEPGGTEKSITVGDVMDLGYNGQIDVKIIDGVDVGGLVRLSRLNASNTIHSQLMKNGVPFTDITQSVATFTMTNQAPVPISFVTPDEAIIPAGTYEGTVVFAISYSD